MVPFNSIFIPGKLRCVAVFIFVPVIIINYFEILEVIRARNKTFHRFYFICKIICIYYVESYVYRIHVLVNWPVHSTFCFFLTSFCEILILLMHLLRKLRIYLKTMRSVELKLSNSLETPNWNKLCLFK